jgi:hypothetical protein
LDFSLFLELNRRGNFIVCDTGSATYPAGGAAATNRI